MKLRTNADKIRRHRARSTPDRIQRYFDTITPEFVDQQREYEEWLRSFATAMRIKHRNHVSVEIFLETSLARYPGETCVVLKATPEK